MGYIKSYIDLGEKEKEEAYKFIQSKDKFIDSFDKLDEKFKVKIYNYGEGVLFYFEDERVIASICTILEVAKSLRTAYIHQMKYASDIDGGIYIIEKLISKAIDISKLKGADNIMLGIAQKEISDEELGKLNLKTEYKSIEMILNHRDKRCEVLGLKNLDEENKFRYIDIFNDSFADMPHGTVTDIENVNKNIEKSKESKNSYFIVLNDDNEEIGFMEIVIENDKGLFDIGLKKEYRGNGYGKRILETAIQFLVEKDAKQIGLIVIEKNKRAYEMYKKRGFEIDYVIGEWVRL